MNVTDRKKGNQWWDIAAIVVVLLLLAGYLYNLTGWRIFDDEGEYLYQVWRMTLNEMPYRDFLTPQLPVFLYAGTAVMELFGNSLWVMRFYSVLLAFLSGGVLFLAGRKHAGSLTGLLAMLLFLLHADVFKEMRIFRNEPIFILFVTLGLVIATWPSKEPRRRWLMAAGICFGLATFVKLFGLLPAGGVGLWLLWVGYREKRPFITVFKDALALSLPMLLLLGVGGILFSWAVPNFFDLVLGHHLAQGSGESVTVVLGRQLLLFWEYLTFYPLLVPLAIISALWGILANDRRQRWAWQLLTVLPFLFLSRQLGQRHFMLLLPAFCLLVGWLLARGMNLNGRFKWWGLLLSLGAFAAIVAPSIRINIDRAGWVDTDTQKIVDFINEQIDEEAIILSDDIGLAYYSQQPTTYAGAALSHGAITSGQITEELLIDEIVADDVQLVIVDVSLLTGNHMVFLRDYPRFLRFLEQNFVYQGNFRRDFQELDIWLRREERPFIVEDHVEIAGQDGTRFGETLRLQGFTFPTDEYVPGETINFTLYWMADAPDENYWSIFAHLVDAEGTIVAQDDKIPYDGLFPTSRWQPGQIVDDRYAIMLPLNIIPGEYQIGIGMYNWQTGERLLLFTEAGEAIPENRTWLDKRIIIIPKS